MSLQTGSLVPRNSVVFGFRDIIEKECFIFIITVSPYRNHRIDLGYARYAKFVLDRGHRCRRRIDLDFLEIYLVVEFRRSVRIACKDQKIIFVVGNKASERNIRNIRIKIFGNIQEYFADAKSDAEIIQTIYDAYNQNISKYLYADVANVSFGGLIPNDKYYLLIFACNPDGSPKLDDKINLKKVEVNTSPAAMSSVQYELSVSSITKIDAMVTVRADGNYENETFLFNYITKAEYDAISGDKTAGLKAHMDAFIDARVKDWNDSHPNSGVMTRKEFLSRALMNGKEDLFVPIEIGGLTPGTTYYLYVFGLKADGTYTTEPVTTQFTTVADQVTLASLEFIVMSYGYPEENRNMYRVWTYANNSKEHYFQSFVGEDEWAGKTASEVRELLKASRWPSSSSYKVDAQFGQTWYGYSVAYDEAGIPTKVYKLWHTSPADTGDGFDNITGGTITVDIEELSE